MKTAFLLAVLLAACTSLLAQPTFVAPTNESELKERVVQLRSEYAPYLRSLPQTLPGRERTAVPAEWKFTFEAKATPKVEGIPPAPAWQGVDFDDAKWETTTVPEWRYRTREGDDTARNPDKLAQWKNSETTADTICWYRTTFRAKPPVAGKRMWLCFDGVEWEAQVYLNGELLGTHRVYYEPFRFDVTGKLKPNNTLAVRVISGRSYGQPMTYWGLFPDIRAAQQRYVPDRAKSISGNLPIGYHSGCGFGIFRDVYMEQTGPVRIDAVFARNDLSDGKARVKVELDGQPAEVQVEVLPENFEGRSYTKVSKDPTVEIPMPDAKGWSPESPNLYRCRVTVKGSDVKDVLFGCRSFTIINCKEEPPTMPVYTFAPVTARWLRILGRGSDASTWNSIWEVDCPALVRDADSVSASKPNKDYPPKLALDGKLDTRWALEGRGEWIQFQLDDTVAFDHVKIGWYEAEARDWDFDLLVSTDKQNWTKLDYKKPEAPKSAALPSGMLMLNGKAVYLRGTNISGGMNVYSYWGQTNELFHALLLLKAGNFNCVRSCQHVEFPEVREWMDRVGMMSEQDQGGGYRGSIDMGIRREQHIHTGTVLARETYNNPGVVLLTFGNEHKFDTTPIVRAVLAVDPQRVIKPISGRYFNDVPNLPIEPVELWPNIISDNHDYRGWYGAFVPQTWKEAYQWKPRRLITIGEYGAEALDAYETMRDHYPPQFKPPAPDTDTLWAASQVQKHDAKQISGLGRKPQNLAEYIEASQNCQEAMMADKTIGYRLSPRAISGYFHFHFIDVIPVHWPKSIVSHDHRPKKAYYQFAQINQPVVALPQLTGAHPDAMTLWIANDLPEPIPQATLCWTVSHAGQTLLEGQQKLDVPAVNAVAGEKVDLSAIAAKYPAFDVVLMVSDATGKLISRYQRTVRVVPPELLGQKSTTADPFNKKTK